MPEYIEVFRVEAKSLLKNFRDNDKNAVARCRVVFGGKTDLSLMNMQHVIAKEYGFNDWNELSKVEDWRLAEALIKAKNKNFTTPFSAWTGDGILQVEDRKWLFEARGVPMVQGAHKVIAPKKGHLDGCSLRYCDVSGIDFSDVEICKIFYNEGTNWPKDNAKLPKGDKPQAFLEKRKNAGLGVKALHKQGVTGKGRAVAVISDAKLADHLEYHYNVKDYEELCYRYDNNGGSFNASMLVGNSCGVAPKADLYYYAVSRQQDVRGAILVDYAKALEKVCDKHQKLLAKGKAGIDAVCMPNIYWVRMENDEGYEAMKKAVAHTKELGIFIISASLMEDYGLYEGAIWCTNDGHPDNPADYESILPVKDVKKSLCFPFGGMTVADFGKMGAYCYVSAPILGRAWETGLYLLAKSVKPDLTLAEFWNIGLKTGDFKDGIGTIVNPQRLINELMK